MEPAPTVWGVTVTDPAWAREGQECFPSTARKWRGIRVEHSIPISLPEDEAFDIGHDTRTGVALLEYHYDVPFKFTGKINKITFTVGPEQLTDEDKANLPAIAHAAALVKD